jgi:hypothetical protein
MTTITSDPGGLQCPDISDSDIFEAMKEIQGYLDITPADLKEIYRHAFRHARERINRPIKAVEIIDALEPHSRSYYCGSAGLILRNGDFTQSVLIRTAIGQGSGLSYYAGCGIVWDSVPEQELGELYLKMKAFSLAGAGPSSADAGPESLTSSHAGPVCDKV